MNYAEMLLITRGYCSAAIGIGRYRNIGNFTPLIKKPPALCVGGIAISQKLSFL
jgi:hypothetical protein